MAFCAYCGSHVAQVSFVACASCGNPTNGAPSRPAGGGTNAVALVIGIAVAGLVVVAIIGILAAIAIPNLLTAQQRSRQKRTMADMRTVATALEAYASDHNEYPPGSTVAELRSHLEPKYVQKLPALDGWTTSMRYALLPEPGYAIVSAGADKTFELESPAEYTPGATHNFDCDMVFANGQFVQYPEGVQSGGGR